MYRYESKKIHCGPLLSQTSASTAADKRNVSDAEYQKSVDAVMSQLTDAERAVDGILKEATTAMASKVTAPGGEARAMASAQQQQHLAEVPGDAGFLADEVADQLRARLKELARQLADLQVRRRRLPGHLRPTGRLYTYTRYLL